MQPTAPLIPEARVEPVKQVLLQTFQTSDISDIQVLGGGFSGCPIYKIVIAGQTCLLKLNPIDPDYKGPEDPVTCTDVASEAGVAPKVYYSNEKNGIDITAFIKKKPLRELYPTQELLMKALAASLRSIHSLPLFPKTGSLLDMADSDISELGQSQVLPNDLLTEALSKYGIMREAYPWNDSDRVSSHNDLNPNNILCDGQRIWIIDWSTSYVSDRYYDLSVVANFMVSDKEEEEWYLKAYFGEGLNEYVRARFFLMRQICRLIYAGLMLELSCPAEHPELVKNIDWKNINIQDVGDQLKNERLKLSTHEGKLMFGVALLNEALSDMRQPYFEEAVNTVRSKKD